MSMLMAGPMMSTSTLMPIFPSSGLLAYWKLDENTGTSAADSSGNGHTGTLTNSGLWTSSGQINSAIQSDGTNRYINLGTASNLLSIPTSGFAYAFWVYTPTANPLVRVLDLGLESDAGAASNNKGLSLLLVAGEVRFRIQQATTTDYGGGPGTWATGLTIQTGWNLVVCNRTTTSAEAYIYNTTEQISNSTSGSYGNLTTWTSRANRIGAIGFVSTDSTLASATTTGVRLDEIGVWDSTLDASDRSALWNNGDGLQP